MAAVAQGDASMNNPAQLIIPIDPFPHTISFLEMLGEKF